MQVKLLFKKKNKQTNNKHSKNHTAFWLLLLIGLEVLLKDQIK